MTSFSDQNNSKKNINSTAIEAQDKLLPIGFYDLLFSEAYDSHQKINKILTVFFTKNFNLIKPPLFEFEDSYLKNKKDSASFNHYFRSIDSYSGRSLVIRNDITLQINRIYTTKLANAKLPIKLCYVGDVFCNVNNQLYADRQQTQIGCEIIYDQSDLVVFEIIETTLQALEKIDLRQLVINFSLPNFLNLILEQINLENNLRQDLWFAIVNRNLSAIKKINCKYQELLIEITFCNYDFVNLANKIKSIFNQPNILHQINQVIEIYQFIKNNFPDIKPSVTLFNDDINDYHQNIKFEIFSNNFRYSIAKGGDYKLSDQSCKNHQTFNAIGSTIYVNHLRKISNF